MKIKVRQEEVISTPAPRGAISEVLHLCMSHRERHWQADDLPKCGQVAKPGRTLAGGDTEGSGAVQPEDSLEAHGSGGGVGGIAG